MKNISENQNSCNKKSCLSVPDSGDSARGSALLGTSTKFVGKTLQPLLRKPDFSERIQQVNKYVLQSVARAVLLGFKTRKEDDTGKVVERDTYRVVSCCRGIRPGTDSGMVEIKKSIGSQKAHYSGLMLCGSVWTCPVCAAKISERRRNDLREKIDNWRAMGGEVLLRTLTVPHYHNQSLITVLTGIVEARRKMTNNRSWRGSKKYFGLKDEIGCVGLIAAKEVTHGQNGWHVHFHELVFLSGKVTQQARSDHKILYPAVWERYEKGVETARALFRGALSSGDEEGRKKYGIQLDRLFSRDPWIDEVSGRMLNLWESAVSSVGLLDFSNGKQVETFRRRGLDLVQGDSASDYVSKWGADLEMTKSHVKKSKLEGLTPFDFLREVFLCGDEDYSDLFREFAKAFKGRSQLESSRGLNKILGVEEKTDSELAENSDDPCDILGMLTPDAWKLILKQKMDIRADLLRQAEIGGILGVGLYLERKLGLVLHWRGPTTIDIFSADDHSAHIDRTEERNRTRSMKIVHRAGVAGDCAELNRKIKKTEREKREMKKVAALEKLYNQ